MHPDFEAVIGLEVHCQLATDTKIFCSCRAKLPNQISVADIEPNAHVCPVCSGHPGTLPVLNSKAVDFAIQAGLATQCLINRDSVFARKNYFYPDLPKGYQISQHDSPICERGWLDIQTSAGSKRVNIQRIHLEEDAGKNIHMQGYSLVNLNRAGVPLIEVVSFPDMRTAEEAVSYLKALYSIVVFLGICDGNMQEGNFRCDANVSVKRRDATELGTRVEIKNVNSFRFIEKAIDFEIARQIEVVRSGKRVVQETRSYDSARNATISMRSKEEAQDYRYFPDPDLIHLQVDSEKVEALRTSLPELPEQKRIRMVSEYELPVSDAEVLTTSKKLTHLFEAVVDSLKGAGLDVKQVAKQAANWISGEVTRLLNEEGIDLEQSKLTVRHLSDLIQLVIDKTLSSTGAKQVLVLIWKTGESVQTIVEKEGLKQVSDMGALDPIIDRVILAFPQQVCEYRSGKEKLLGFFVGQVMKETQGKANPALLNDLIKTKLKG